ncbi:acyl-CoA carboxylase subunit epsilon [Streptomyces sp. NPDC048392]|uniref:acyl-CoA carboxylase subunit epsilon n=1 Tax=Streptomyces sp. NPDC048392 TaxID=3365543 RepID=UPI003710D7A0
MSGTDGTDEATVLRVLRGRPTPAEIAALTSVLLARAAALAVPSPGPRRTRPTAGWRRPERTAPHRDPRSWHSTGRRPG